MENIRDWNISRQLWWGHQIPAYFYGEGVNDFVVANNKEEALQKAIQKVEIASSIHKKFLTIEDIVQEEDVLDTWFSSWLWPISVFNGINEPENEDINYYYPTNDLVTAPEIMFFWVARMIVSGYEFRGDLPFKNVYYTGIVRDKQGRKMSKSLGNSPDPIELMNKYGADGVRVGMLLCSPAGNDLPFDELLCEQGRNFSNKIWNGFRLVNGWKVSNSIEQPLYSKVAIDWYQSKFQSVLKSVEESLDQFRISEALMSIYKLIWDDFSSWYLEMVKPEFGKPIDEITLNATVAFFEDNIKILHPFIPFITEEIWQCFKERTEKEALIISEYPKQKKFDKRLLKEFENTQEIVSSIRNIRKVKNISFKDKIELFVLEKESLSSEFDEVIMKLCNLSNVNRVDKKVGSAISFRVRSNEFFIPFLDNIDAEEELKKLTEELSYTKGFLNSVQKKLSNKRFVNNAPEQVIKNERKKEADALAKIAMLEDSLDGL
jgi:valyl-tRNA synthetase